MYNHLIETFIDAQTAAWRHYSAIAATEKRLFADMSDPAVRVPGTGEIVEELRRTYSVLADRIITKARQQFAIGAARPVVDRKSVFEQAGFDIERSLSLGKAPDFDRLWLVLETQLGGIRGPAGEQQ
ncbi:hypothetical protein PQR05_30100 [Paraburkholderia sediminicola]|uniref:hypothetical protein n=1 Tax=Paraburkholderia sediminicola TaxID=458836 RepID=UPI0038BDDC33